MAIPTPKIARLGKTELGYEATFGTVAGSFDYLRCDPLDLTSLVQESIEDTHQRTNFTGVPRIPGLRNGTVVVKGPLYGWSNSLPTVAPLLAGHPLGRVFAVAFGIVSEGATFGTVGGLDTWARSTNTITFPGIDGALVVGAAFRPGGTGATTKKKVVWSTSTTSGSPDSATLLQDYGEAATGDVLYGGLTFALADDFDTLFDPGVWEGSFSIKHTDHSGQITTMLGCVPSAVKITLERGKFAMYEITFQVASWSETGGSAPTVGSWSYPQPEVVDCSGLVCFGNDLAVTKPLAKLELDLGLELQPVADINGCGGIGRWFYSAKNPRITMMVLRDPGTEVADWNNQTANIITASWGTVPGRTFAIACPAGVLVEYPQRGEEDQKLVSNLVVEPQTYSGDTGTGAIVDTRLRFAIL